MARERVAESDSPFWAEHRSRYLFAARYTEGRTVLDIACGAGYGCLLLKQKGALAVVGIDLSWQAMVDAAPTLGAGIRLIQANGTALPLASASVDVITSFETLEHIHEYSAFVRELRRVLRPDGLLVLSTPNALISKPVNGVPKNPFHVREFTPDELIGVLQKHFAGIELCGQRVSEDFRPCPYWETEEVLPKTWGGRVQVGIWKVLSRLPLKLRDSLSHYIFGHDFFPGENDFVFKPEFTQTGHALVAVCRA